MVRTTVHYSGRVQGVGFRFTAQRVANRFNVTGYVKNLPDGNVELVAEGEREEVVEFLSAVAEAMSGYIERSDSHEGEATGSYASFGISY